MSESQRYRGRGVSPQKEDVHAAIAGADAGLFPGAFCKLVPDTLTGSAEHCLAMHADGAGTKASAAYLMYRETGDPAWFGGIAQDAMVMNVDDLLCVGARGPFLYSNTIGRNARRVPGEVLKAILDGFARLEAQYADWGMPLVPTGGETADVGDLVRTIIVDVTVLSRMARADVIANDQVQPGDIIIGLASDGQAAYETRPNSGIGSNGLTSARHDLLHKDYDAQFPESRDGEIADDLRFSGPFHLGDSLEGTALTIGEALLSPTRSYAPVLGPVLAEGRPLIGALIHCTGGAQTKCLRVGSGLHYVKDSLFAPPPLFRTLQQVTGTSWREMYEVLNMGHRMEIVGRPELLPLVEQAAAAQGIACQVVGHVEAASPGENRVTLHTPGGVETYALKH